MKLKNWGDKQGLNQSQLAAKLGISQSYISQYLAGKKSFGAKTALRISRLTGISIVNLLYPDGLAALDQLKDGMV